MSRGPASRPTFRRHLHRHWARLGPRHQGRYMAPFRSGEVAAGPSHPASAALDHTPSTTGTNWRRARWGHSRPPTSPPCSVGYPGRSREWLRPCLFGALPPAAGLMAVLSAVGHAVPAHLVRHNPLPKGGAMDRLLRSTHERHGRKKFWHWWRDSRVDPFRASQTPVFIRGGR